MNRINLFRTFVWLIIPVLISLNTFATASKKHTFEVLGNRTLRQVFVVFRHGDRTPDVPAGESYPNDPYRYNTYYPYGYGQLNNEGKLRSYHFGEFLRRRYDNYLGKIYVPDEILGRSTFVVRCKMTLELVLAGLYPPAHAQVWNRDLKWQPTDIIYPSRFEDGLLLSITCPLYQQALIKFMNSDKGKRIYDGYSNLQSELATLTGKPMNNTSDNMSDMVHLYQTFSSQTSLNLKLPSWAYEYFPNGKLKDAVVLGFKILSQTDELKRLGGGMFLYKVIQHMNTTISGKNNKKLLLYSAHDMTVANLLSVLNLYDKEPPAYCSAVIIELHYKRKKYYVKVLYYLGIPPELKELQIPGCDTLCPYGKFLDLTRNVLPFENELVCIPEDDACCE